MSGNVDLPDPVVRNVFEIVQGSDPMVLRGDINIVHIKKDSAVGLLANLAEKFPLRHLGDVKFRVAADIFDADRNFQKVTRLTDFSGRVCGGFKGVRHGEEVVGVAAVHAAPAEVVGEPGGAGAFDKALELAEMAAVQRVRRSKIGGYTVLDDAVLFQDGVKDFQGTSAIDKEIFGDDFKPIHHRLFLQDMPVVRDAEADSDSVIRLAVEGIGWHVVSRSSRWAGGAGLLAQANLTDYFLEPSVAQPPFPLQEFLPLQLLSPDLHPPWPLQLLWPLQEFCPLSAMTVTFVPALADVAAAKAGDEPRIPAMAAVAMSDFVVIFILSYCVLVCESWLPLMVWERDQETLFPRCRKIFLREDFCGEYVERNPARPEDPDDDGREEEEKWGCRKKGIRVAMNKRGQRLLLARRIRNHKGRNDWQRGQPPEEAERQKQAAKKLDARNEWRVQLGKRDSQIPEKSADLCQVVKFPPTRLDELEPPDQPDGEQQDVLKAVEQVFIGSVEPFGAMDEW